MIGATVDPYEGEAMAESVGDVEVGHVPETDPLTSQGRIGVQAALRQLMDDGLIHRFDGRGYLVGSGQAAAVSQKGQTA
mgnify:CR=1 FL=1